MWEVVIECIASAVVCLTHSVAPQPAYVPYHYTRRQCIVELDRMIVSFNQGSAAYRFRCLRRN